MESDSEPDSFASPPNDGAEVGADAVGIGRPSMWNQSGERKLTRLYTYTTLSMTQIRKALEALRVSNTDKSPGKDSTNKKLSSNLDKQPRWLRPKNISDAQLRVNGLAHAPIRRYGPRSPLARAHAPSVSSNVSSHDSVDQAIEAESNMVVVSNQTTGLGIWPEPSSHEPSLTAVAKTEVNLFQADPSAVSGPPDFGLSAAALLRRSTVLSTSTEMSSRSLREALPELGRTALRLVTRVAKQYTMMPQITVISEGGDTAAPTHSGNSDMSSSPWLEEEEGSDRLPIDFRPRPGSFLRLDHQLRQQIGCLPGVDQHDFRSCYCYVRDELTAEHWVHEHGVSGDAEHVFLHGLAATPNIKARDPFGNTYLHLLAARDGPLRRITDAIAIAPDPLATNSAGETFLHLLGSSWYSSSTITNQLVHPLKTLERGGHDIYACDASGRSIFHMLEDMVENKTLLNRFLHGFESQRYHRRDAFGSAPGAAPIINGHLYAPNGDRFTAWSQTPPLQDQSGVPAAASAPPSLSDEAAFQALRNARLMGLVRHSQSKPLMEDHKGRNGLHCLAAAILSEDTLLAKYNTPPPGSHSPGAHPNPRKRRLNTPCTDRKLSDASRGRLNVRADILHNLLACGVDSNHYAHDGTTPLMAFVARLPEDGDHKGPVVILEKLIDNGARIEARNRQGETALHVAVRCGRKLAVRTLVKRGASVHARNAAGRSVLDVADSRMFWSRNQEKEYSHYEACRAWLSGEEARAVQQPTVAQEWAWREL
ncbi:Acyl-CoA-binding domain-containing protein 1 like [Verticillium longisporum]|uniref:Acyl-CoA-binding domain-containing protein 1 like n=1 Tax=Verticillium longisporum TaxID=100787 RepID=A0A8I3A3L6_VERLO|nr:Acyl-CoA-binding domain-containing protein 1 like [Verticillium longisporum]